MSSKKAMKLAQKQAFAKHRSNISNNKFGLKKLNFVDKAIKARQNRIDEVVTRELNKSVDLILNKL